MAVIQWRSAESFGAISINPFLPWSFVRMTVGSRGMFVGEFAMFESGNCVLFRLFVLAEIVKMGRLKVMVRGGVVMTCCLKVMLTRRMLRCLCHLRYSYFPI